MPRFRVSDLMINVGEGGGGGCHLITNCGGVTELWRREHAGLRVHGELQLHDPHVLP